jgi:sensor histidine kinase YesM
MDAYHILVIVLSSLLGLILLATAIISFIFIKIMKDVRHITEKASMAADNIEHAAMFFKKTSGAAAITKLVGNAVEMFRSKKSSKE